MNQTASETTSALELVRDRGQLSALVARHRVRMLEQLQQPDTATGVARRLGMPRQQVNYHLRELERAGLVELVEERRKGNCVERVVRATARSFVISPEVIGELAVDPADVRDRFSSSYLVAVAARTIRELAELRAVADAADKRLATLTLETELRFASAAERNGFAKELSEALARLIVKYHDAEAAEGRCYRVLLGAYPTPLRQSENQPVKGDEG